MSHQVMINYQGVSIQIQAQCDTAVASLCKIDKALDNVHKTAKSLEHGELKEYEDYLLKSKETIRKKIDEFKASLEEYKAIQQRYANYQEGVAYFNWRNKVEAQSAELSRIVADFAGSKLDAINQMISQGLLEEGNNVYETLRKEASDQVEIDENVRSKINAIEDVSLRQFVYMEALKNENAGLSFDELKKKGEDDLDDLLNHGKEEISEQYKEEMRQSGVSEEKIEELSSKPLTQETIQAMNEASNDAKIDEKVRKETLKVIIKAIKDRGFIVDTKHNLKIDKGKNVVHLVALKASGQKAEFEVQLSGKFMYRFDGYEGQACKKDIHPFMDDLKNVYDINVLHEEVIWDNPDKIQHKQYQHMKENKGSN